MTELDRTKLLVMHMEKLLFQVAYSVKSCRAGDGDMRTWEVTAGDCEHLAELGLDAYAEYLAEGYRPNDIS